MVDVKVVVLKKEGTIALPALSFHCHVTIAKLLVFGCRTKMASGIRKVRVSLLKCHPDINFPISSPWMWVFAFKLIVFQNTPSATLTTFKRWNILWDEELTNPPLLAALPPVIKYSASYTYACIYRASWICRVGVSYLKSLVEPSQLIVTAQSQTEKVTSAKSSVVLTGIAQLTIPISHRKWCNSFDWRCIMRSNPRVSTNGPEFAMLIRSRGALASC